jgi:Outer membrane lipoprotein-sorting protein
MISPYQILRVWFSLGVILLFVTGAPAQTTNGLSDAEIQGQKLVQDILQGTPTENLKQAGTLIIRDSKGNRASVPVNFTTVITNGYWEVCYLADPTNNYYSTIILTIRHQGEQPNKYMLCQIKDDRQNIVDSFPVAHLAASEIMVPFAGSDFWIADLGLEFFHWPQQKVLRHESKKTRACTVLESTNPNPAPGAYSRVVTWIDNESHAIIYAEAYDVNNKLLKEFNPKKVKKVNGQWELEEMDIRNRQTGSRTWITFDLNGKS